MRVEFSQSAIIDMAGIHGYICASTNSAAAKWFQRLTEAILELSTFPERGMRLYKTREARRILFGKKPHIYRIVYKVEKRRNVVLILRVEYGPTSQGNR